MPRPEHPLVVALVESYAREIGVPPSELWGALDGKPARAELVRGLVEAFFPLVREDDFAIEGLAPPRKRATLHTMHTTEIEPPNPRGGRPSRLKRHPLMVALKKAGVTVADEAATVRRSVSSVRSFCFAKANPAYRPIPRAIAERWEEVYGVPMATWPRIAD